MLKEFHGIGLCLLGYLNTLLHKAPKKTKSNIASNMGIRLSFLLALLDLPDTTTARPRKQ